jgi:hypothetical protein
MNTNTVKTVRELGVMVHACNPNAREDEAGGSPAQDHPGLDTEILSQNKQTQ